MTVSNEPCCITIKVHTDDLILQRFNQFFDDIFIFSQYLTFNLTCIIYAHNHIMFRKAMHMNNLLNNPFYIRIIAGLML